MTSPHADVEDVLCSKTRLKILKLLMQLELLTIFEIAKRTTVNYASAKAHLEILENDNILVHFMFGKRIRYYKDSPIAQAIKELIEAYSDR
jgi:DNA-binding transcriptional ArsR family regulator